MRHIDKDLNNAPESLKPATIDFFAGRDIPDKADKTHSVRINMVKSGKYIDEADSLYKAEDVKEKLEELYLNKCAYCEQYVESYHVEHYRPKRAFQNNTAQKHNGYCWLSLSWDNLMLACPKCNEKKGSKFDIKGSRVTTRIAPKTNKQWKFINVLSIKYDQIEKPLLLNPERVNPEDHLEFSIDGHIGGKSEEGIYTIKTCDLDRKKLVDERRKIINELVSRLSGIMIRYINDLDKLEERLADEYAAFSNELDDLNKPFTLFRKNAKNWYDDITKEALKSNKKDIQ